MKTKRYGLVIHIALPASPKGPIYVVSSGVAWKITYERISNFKQAVIV